MDLAARILGSIACVAVIVAVLWPAARYYWRSLRFWRVAGREPDLFILYCSTVDGWKVFAPSASEGQQPGHSGPYRIVSHITRSAWRIYADAERLEALQAEYLARLAEDAPSIQHLRELATLKLSAAEYLSMLR